MIWADFTYELALGFQPPEPKYIVSQQLTLTNPRVVKKYNKILRQEHSRQKIGPRAFDLQTSVPSGLKQHHHKEFETIAHLDDCT
jgi:hypothetical protein